MEKLTLFLLLCVSSSAVKHSLKIFSTLSSGVTNLPEFIRAILLDDVEAGYCVSKFEIKQIWVKQLLDENPKHLQWYRERCVGDLYIFRARIDEVKQHLNHSGGVHVFQLLSGCEWDDETGESVGIFQIGYDGEDFISLDMKTESWVAAKPQADVIKQRWDVDKGRINSLGSFYFQTCFEWLKTYVDFGKKFLLRSAPPSVSLLQKTPSSPVSCHATGFYPHRALMFWTKDGEELHEDMDQGEILPNHDGTFQTSVDLDVSSVEAEDWRRYDCVFLLSGVKDHIVTKLDRAQIRTNMEKSSDSTMAVVVAVVALVVVLVCSVVGFIIYKKRTAELPAPPPGDTELTENLKPT